jgi:hypothetical protein
MMNLRKSCTAAGLAVALLTTIAHPAAALGQKKSKDQDNLSVRKLSPAQSALVDKAVAREQEVIKTIKDRTPLVETYIQNMRPDPVMLQIPASDEHFLGRVDFGKVISGDAYEKGDQKKGFFKGALSYLTTLNKQLHLEFNETGFVQMLLVDSQSFNRENYEFAFVRNDFLGSVPTVVFDVMPASKHVRGRFFGRVWIERNGGNVVRFNGSFAGSERDFKEFYHFDSWRTNVQNNMWLPTSAYIEESDPRSKENTVRFKAINNIWGYVLRTPPADASNVDVQVQGATDVSQDAQDTSPLGAQRAWVQQAEDNVVDRLFKAGLLDAPSDFDKILEQIAGNILAYNNIQVARPIRVRTLLTEPLESLAIGNTIVLSRSLIDTTAVPDAPGGVQQAQVANLYAVIAFQLSHIILGHRLDTKYAFNDRLLFPNTAVFQNIPMHHTDIDNEEAAKKTLELLKPKELQDAAATFGLYLTQLSERSKALTALNEPVIGDSLIRDVKTNTFWLQSMVGKGIKLNQDDLKQYAAMPLGSFLRFDPWTDQVIQMHASYEPLLSSRDKMPFEVTPVFLKLSYYKAGGAPGAAAASGAGVGANTTVAPAPAVAEPSAGTAPTAATTSAVGATGTANPQ